MIFKGVLALVFVWWLEAFIHQLSVNARMRCSTLTILQQKRNSLLEIQLESTAFLA